jgi:hypothetical protein
MITAVTAGPGQSRLGWASPGKARQFRQGMSQPAMVWLDKLETLDDPVRDEPQAGQAAAAEDPTGS